MAIDTEALRVREIERGSRFTPIQFGDVARSAIGVAQQFTEGQDALEQRKLKREQAAQMQTLLNGGQNALFQAIGQLEPEDQKRIFGGDPNTIKSVTSTPEGLINGWKAFEEIQTANRVAAAPDRPGQAGELLKSGGLTGKDFLSATKPVAGASGISNKLAGQFDATVRDAMKSFKKENGRKPEKIEALEIIQNAGIDLNVRADDPIRKVITDKFVTASAVTTPKIQSEKFEEEKKQRVFTAVRKMGAKFTTKKREVVIAANEVNRAIDGGVFGDKFKNLISSTFLDGLKERLQLSEDSPNVIATIINTFIKAKLKDTKEAERVRRVKADPKFKELFQNPEFNKVMVSLSTLMTKVLRLESGAAITGTDIEDKKNNFGFDAIGTPESFLIGIGNFMEGLRADVVQIRKDEPDPEAKELFTKGFEGSKLASPFNLPKRPLTGQEEIEGIDADLELLK